MSSYTITTPEAAVELSPSKVESKGTAAATVTYSVTNRTGRTLPTRLRIVPDRGAEPGWFQVEGEGERDVAPGQTVSFPVKISTPGAKAPKPMSFHAQAVNLRDPDNDFADGPAVAFTPPTIEAADGGFKWKWWMIAAPLALLLIAGGVIAAISWGNGAPPGRVAIQQVEVSPAEMTSDNLQPVRAVAVATLAVGDAEGEVEALEADDYSIGFTLAPVSAVTSEGVPANAVLADAPPRSQPPLAPDAAARIEAEPMTVSNLSPGAYIVCALASRTDNEADPPALGCGGFSVQRPQAGSGTVISPPIVFDPGLIEQRTRLLQQAIGQGLAVPFVSRGLQQPQE